MKRRFIWLPLIVVILALAWFYRHQLEAVKPVILPPPADIAQMIEEKNLPGENVTEFPLKIADNFKIEVFAKNLPGARVLVWQGSDLWVSQTAVGRISKLTLGGYRQLIKSETVFSNLRKPHGLAFDPDNLNILFIAEEHRVSRVDLSAGKKLEKIVDLPTAGGGHFTRTIKFGPDGKLYVSIGSSCNVCREQDARRAAIYSMNKDGSDFKIFASGLRNSVFFTWAERNNQMWATENGRDLIGDDIPPDEINIIHEGKNYGWPNCFGKNIHDTNFDKNIYVRNPCLEPFETPAHVDIKAHSAALGLAFIPDEASWPEEYRGDLLVALHGSWNSTVPTGYKIIWVKLDEKGEYEGTEDFISGWLTANNEALGRPVDILVETGGLVYITDDKAGLVYRLSYEKN